MPTKPKQYTGPLQIRIIKAIALAGHLSNSKLTDRLKVRHPVISDALKSLWRNGLIEFSYTDETRKTKTHKSGGRSEKYYALTKNGLDLFIDKNPTPEEFFDAVLKFYMIREQSVAFKPMKIEEFEDYFKLFEKKYMSYTSTHGYLVQSPFFSKLYKQWLVDNKPYFFEQEHLEHITNMMQSPFFEKCLDQLFEKFNANNLPITQKVLECLAIHRSLTEEQIIEHLDSKQKEIEKKLAGKTYRYPESNQNHIQSKYAITRENIARVIDRYTLKNVQYEFQASEEHGYSKIMKSYVEFLSHLIIVKLESPDGLRYELSLFGILLILAIVADRRQKMFHVKITDNKFQKMESDLILFYNNISQAYSDKLPLIFGKWALLSGISHDAYRWFLPVLNQIIEDATQYESVPVKLGGIKEYQDCMNGITFYTTTQLFKIYQGLSSTLSTLSNTDQKDDSEIPLINIDINSDSEIPLINIDINSDISLALSEKENELAALLKYSDLGRFVSRLETRKIIQQDNQVPDSIYSSELQIIEEVLANEITFLFYINLVKSEYLDYCDENKYFLGEERDTEYRDNDEYHILRPTDFLRTILRSDKDVKDMILGWISDIMKYQQQTGEHMNEFCENIKKWKRRSNR